MIDDPQRLTTEKPTMAVGLVVGNTDRRLLATKFDGIGSRLA